MKANGIETEREREIKIWIWSGTNKTNERDLAQEARESVEYCMSEAGWVAYRREKDAIQAETGGSPVVRPLHAAPAQRTGQRRRLPTREDGP